MGCLQAEIFLIVESQRGKAAGRRRRERERERERERNQRREIGKG